MDAGLGLEGCGGCCDGLVAVLATTRFSQGQGTLRPARFVECGETTPAQHIWDNIAPQRTAGGGGVSGTVYEWGRGGGFCRHRPTRGLLKLRGKVGV